MKKFLALLCCLFFICSCSSKKQDLSQELLGDQKDEAQVQAAMAFLTQEEQAPEVKAEQVQKPAEKTEQKTETKTEQKTEQKTTKNATATKTTKTNTAKTNTSKTTAKQPAKAEQTKQEVERMII